MISVYKDNAGGVLLFDGRKIFDMTGVVSQGSGLQDMIDAAEGDTRDWTVPSDFAEEPPFGQEIARYEGDVRLWVNEMGSSALAYFHLRV